MWGGEWAGRWEQEQAGGERCRRIHRGRESLVHVKCGATNAKSCRRRLSRGATTAVRRWSRESNLLMCAGETREAAFWESLHASTTRGPGPTFTMASEGAAKAVLYNSAGRAATTPDDGNQAQRTADMKLNNRMIESSSYDFLADIEGGNSQALPFLDDMDSVRSSTHVTDGLSYCSRLRLHCLRYMTRHCCV